MKRLPAILLVLLLLPTLSFAQRMAAKDIIARINRGEAIALKNVHIEGDLDLTHLDNRKLKREERQDGDKEAKIYISTVTAPLSFTGCTFTGKVLGFFNPNANSINRVKTAESFNTNFNEEVRFENCTFEGEVTFKYSGFGSKVSFAGSRFQDLAEFKYTKFAQGPDFSKASFRKESVFKYVKFPQGASFAAAAFQEDADFKYAEFLKGGNFAKTSFGSFANFKYTQLAGPVNFTGATFNGNEDFKYTQLNGRRVNLAELAK
jgi:uncharacterized protein YjbI with pentapeptide repeats